MCGFLLDAVNDPDCSAGALREEGFPEEVADVLMTTAAREDVMLEALAIKVADSCNPTAVQVFRNHLEVLRSEAEEHGDDELKGEIEAAIGFLVGEN